MPYKTRANSLSRPIYSSWHSRARGLFVFVAPAESSRRASLGPYIDLDLAMSGPRRAAIAALLLLAAAGAAAVPSGLSGVFARLLGLRAPMWRVVWR